MNSVRGCAQAPSWGVIDLADHGIKAVAVDVIGEFRLIEAPSHFHRLRQHLPRRITERHEGVTDRIDLFASRFGLIALEHAGDAREVKAWRRDE